MFTTPYAAAAFPCLATVQLTYWLAWAGSFVLSVTLVIMLWTRWGQSRPLHKCAALSLLVHLILAFLTMTVRIVVGDGGGGGGGSPPIRVRIVQEGSTAPSPVVANVVAEAPSEVAPPPLLEPPANKEEPTPTIEPDTTVAKAEETPPIAEDPIKEQAKAIVETTVANETPPAAEKTQLVQTNEKVEAPEPPTQPVAKQTEPPADAASGVALQPQQTAAQPAPVESDSPVVSVATPYSLRNAPGRLGIIAGQGGNAETEAAVGAALRWLATAQSRDGRWNAVQFGAGQEEMVLGQNRGGAGRNADTGISALALLAFLGAGHTHLQGEYRETVHRGLDFLLRTQAADGSLFGDSTLYAQMYCHSMATFALAEAQAMSGDRRLEPAVTKAVNYCLAAQNPATGGWRYRPGDTGDTSQLGWQIMALASAERAGIDVPDQTWNRIERFLQSVRRGNSGGLASYRPDSPATTSMTAEALYCRLVLEEMSVVNLVEPAAGEATTQLLAALPSADRVNLYYWYYATLALHHRQQSSDTAATAWHTWNDAMTAALINTQMSGGNDAGSWNANSMWGGYGGRVYTTAMAAMCLEVYYRYAPTARSRGRWMATRPQSQTSAN